MAELIITISPSGETNLDIKGASGPGCRKFTQSLEAALGTIIESKRKPEYNCAAETGCVNTSA
jgi:hypothetical protein